MNTDTITHIDCLKSLPHIQDQSIDIVLTDPPNGKGLSAEEAIDGLIGLYHAAKKAKRYVVFFASPFYVPTAPPDWYEVARHVWHKPDARSRASYELIIVWAREYKLQRCRVLTITPPEHAKPQRLEAPSDAEAPTPHSLPPHALLRGRRDRPRSVCRLRHNGASMPTVTTPLCLL